MTLEEALIGIEIPPEIKATLAIISVPYTTFDNTTKEGQLVVHTDLAEEIREIFDILHQNKFPIHKIVPAAAYNWNDEASMADNNTSAFNYRRIVGTDRLSNHSHGCAIDINPLQNPYFARDGKIYPNGSTYDRAVRGTITAEGIVVRSFKERGWTWLGERTQNPDYQHFEKPLT